MSTDTAKENASVVDSSLTEYKQDIGNLDDPESSSYKPDKDGCPTGSEEIGDDHNQLGNTIANKKTKLCGTRYFIIKSLNHQNIQLSMEKGLWATQVMNEPILEEAFHNSGKVILIFSVNMSGFFQGYAQMMSTVGRRENIWSQGRGKNNPWGRSFRVKWLRLSNLPFQKTLHLKNPLNDYKPVKISRDCQELPPDIGEALCELLDESPDVNASIPSPCIDPSSSLQDEEYGMPPVPLGWPSAPVLYPPLIYQQHVEASRFPFPNQRSAGCFAPEDFPISPGASKIARRKHSHSSGNPDTAQEDHSVSSRYDSWGLPAESLLGSTLTEDDLLEMSYEEYLEAHSRARKQLYLQHAARPPWTKQELSRSKNHDENRESSSVAPWPHPHKRVRHS